MSADAGALDGPNIEPDLADELEDIAEDLKLVRKDRVDKVAGPGRIRDNKKESVRNNAANTVANLARAEIEARKTATLAELQADVERLKADRDLS